MTPSILLTEGDPAWHHRPNVKHSIRNSRLEEVET